MPYLSRAQRKQRAKERIKAEARIAKMREEIGYGKPIKRRRREPLVLEREDLNAGRNVAPVSNIIAIPQHEMKSKRSVVDEMVLRSESAATVREIKKKAAMVAPGYVKGTLQYDPSAQPAIKTQSVHTKQFKD